MRFIIAALFLITGISFAISHYYVNSILADEKKARILLSITKFFLGMDCICIMLVILPMFGIIVESSVGSYLIVVVAVSFILNFVLCLIKDKN